MNQNRSDDDVQSPMQIMGEQSLAVDLAAVEIDRQIATAHKFPRSLDLVIKKIGTMACYNDAAAENCIYSLPRGGKPIIGPSIGFANILAQAWGNCIDGGRPIYADRKEKSVIAEGVFHDLESNRKTVVHVSRRIVDKNGRLYSDDMIAVTGMAAASIARRNAIINAVPRALWFPVYEDALAIVRGTVETFTASKDKALKSFHQFGIKSEQIIAFLGLKGEADLTLEHIPILRGAYSALRDGNLTPEEVMDPRRQAGAGFERVANPLMDDDHDQQTGEVHPREPLAGQPERTAAELKEGRSIHSGEGERGPGPRQDGEGGDDDDGAPGGDQQQGGTPPAGADATQLTGGAAPLANASAGSQQQPQGGGDTKRVRPSRAKAKPAEQRPAEQPKPAEAGGAETAKPDAKPVEPAKAEAPPPAGAAAASAAPVEPKTTEQYRAHAMAWIASTTSLSALDDQWKSERDLRTSCMVVEDVFSEIKLAYTQRQAALKAKGPA